MTRREDAEDRVPRGGCVPFRASGAGRVKLAHRLKASEALLTGFVEDGVVHAALRGFRAAFLRHCLQSAAPLTATRIRQVLQITEPPWRSDDTR